MKQSTTFAQVATNLFNLLQGYTKGIRITAILILLLMGVSNAWANGGIGYKGVKFTKNSTTTGWYNIHNVTWDYAHSSYECRSGKSGVTNFNNADLGVVTSLKLHSFVVIGWTDNSDWVSGQLKYRTYLQSASAGNYNVYNVGNYETYCNATDVLVTSGNNRVVGKNGTMNLTLVDDNTTPGKYYLQLQGMGRMRYCNGDFNTNNGSEIKASYTVPGFTKTSATQDFGNVNVESDLSKTISFTNHYGTTLTTSDCVLSGTNKSEFSVTSISETGVTVKFTPSSSGSKTATLTITDAHSKKCTIELSGTATLPTYTVTFNANGHGTAPDEQTVTQGSKATQPTAPTATGYTFGGWYKESNCVNAFDFNTAIYADITLYAKWTENATNSLTVAAGAGIASVAGSTNPVTLGSTYAITATPKTGYTFSTWTADPAANATFGSATTANTTVTVNNGSVTVTASATEIMSTLTTSNQYNAGNPGYAAPSATVSEIGIATTATVTAAAGNGYTFTGWTLTNCTRTDDGAADATSITVRSNGDGKAATVTANYAEDLTTNWVLRGSFVDDFGTAYNFNKKSGESTGKVAYVSLDLADSKAYQFKVVDGDTWYGNNNSNEQYWIKATAENWEFYSDAGNCHMKSSVAGTYTFKIDFSGTYPKVSVQFPTAYKVTYGVGTTKGTTSVTTNPSITSGALVLASTSITFSKDETKAGYQWKNWNSKADGSGTDLGTGDTYVSSNREADITVYACYDHITYNITYDLNGGSGASNTTYNVESATITLPTDLTKTGHTFAGWYDNESFSGTAVTEITKGSTGDKNFYAKWTANTYTIIFHKNGEGVTGEMANQTLTYDQSANLTANVFELTNCTFEGWATAQDGEVVYTDGQEILNLASEQGAEVNLYAKWNQETHNVKISANGPGSTDPTGEQTVGAVLGLEVTANPNPGYEFTSWSTSDGVTATEGNPTTVKATADGTLVANFSEIKRTITIATADAEQGTVSPASVNAGVVSASTEITATPHEGYEFVNWTPSDGITLANAADATTTITKATADGTVTAHFQEKKHDVAIVSINDAFGTVSPATVSVGQHTASEGITATPKFGYRFVNWTADSGIEIADSNSKTTTIKASAAGSITANFEPLEPKTVYLKPTGYWPDANARLSVYAWDNGGDKWFEMENVSCAREYFKVDIPAKYTQFKFVRLKPTTDKDYDDNNEGLNWENKWNETSNLTIPTGNKDLYTFPDNHIYLKPNSNWTQANARFAAYFFVNEDDSKTKWMSMFEGEDGVYYCDIPTEESYDRVIFCRMNPGTSDNKWDNKWNQTSDLTWDGANNLYTVKDGTWSEGGGTWSIYWSTYKAPSYKVKLVADSHGTYKVKYGEKTATSKIEGDVEIEVPLNTIITISTNEAKPGYKQENAAIEIGNQDHIAAQLDTEYTICGPTTITGNFVAATDTKVYLEPTENWKKDNARFKAFVFDDTHSEWLADLMTLVSCDENNPIYSCILPAGYHSVIFCRVKDNSVNDFNYEEGSAFWNQTNDLLIPVGSDKNRYTITSTGSKKDKENANGNWNSPPTYEIILNPGEHGTITVSPSTSVALGETITATLTPNTGYSKDEAKITIGNNEEETLVEGQEYSICGPTTITATWTPNPHTVTWIVDGVKSVVDYNYGDAIAAPEDPTKTGYTFAGWGKEIPATMPDEDLEFTAQWTINTYTVQWSVNGEIVKTETVAYGATASAPDIESPYPCDADVFAGWVKDELEMNETDRPADEKFVTSSSPTITENTTFYAVFADYEN